MPPPNSPAPRGRPNVILFQSDDAAWQTLGPFSPYVKWTPNFDRLAREGMTFDRCHCENAICSPARAAMLTGKLSHLHGVLDNFTPFDGRQQTFPKLLQGAGYQTAMIGKWHLHSFPTGFDYYSVMDCQGVYNDCPFIEARQRVIRPGYVDHTTRDLGIGWLKNRDPNRPFLMIQSFKSPHRPWLPSPERMRGLEEVEFPEPTTLLDDYRGRSAAAHEARQGIRDDLNEDDLKLLAQAPAGVDPGLWREAYAGRRAEWEKVKSLRGPALTRWKYRMHMLDYARMIATLDDEIGATLRYLDEAGLADNTIVLYSSDHGMFVGEHGFFDKRFMYEEAFRVPFFVRWPGVVKPGSRCSALAQNIDYAPTIIEAAGVPVPAKMQGRSLVPLLQGRLPADWRTSLYYHYYEYGSDHRVYRHEGVATASQKLIHFYGQNEWEYYDRQTDPRELANRAADPGCAAAVAGMKAELERLRHLYGVPPNGPMGWVDGEQPMEMMSINRRLAGG